MTLIETRYEHIILNDKGVPVIAGTTMKVIELVLSHQAYGWSAEELHFQYPYLTMGQIHSALDYYWDNKAALDEDIKQRPERAEQIERELGPSPLLERLKTEKPA
jgi:uncharacterized protein (DUF433 family)